MSISIYSGSLSGSSLSQSWHFDPKPAKEIYKIGSRVNVGGFGACFSENVGTVVGLNDEYPYKAQVRLEHKNGSATTCWIKTMYLSFDDSFTT